MTTLKVSISDWDIPTILNQVKDGVNDATKAIAELSNKLDEVSKAQEKLKTMAKDITHNHDKEK